MKRLFILGLMLSSFIAVSAQDENTEEIADNTPQTYFLKHHVNFNLGGGLHTMISDPINGDWGKGFGGLFEAKYEFINKVIGFNAGVKISLLNGETSVKYRYVIPAIVHPKNGQDCRLTNIVSDWKERESMWALEVPLQFAISTDKSKSWSFHGGIGAALSLQLGGKYEVTDGYIMTSGWFEQTKVEMNRIRDAVIGRHTPDDIEKGKIKYAPIGVNAIVDLGVLRNLTPEYALYLGLYGSYGLLNVCTEDNSTLFNGFEFTSLYNSDQVSKIIPVEAGVKIGIYFSFHDTEKEITEMNRTQSERVEKERQEAEAAAAERSARVAEKSRKQELEKAKQEKKDIELAKMNLASLQEAKEALKTIQGTAKYANINAAPTFPKTTDEAFLIVRKYLNANPDAKIIITGHTDNSGTAAKNIVNGQHRAEAFKNALIRKDIPRGRIGCVSKGDTEPIASNDTEEGRAKNRRIELDLVDSNTIDEPSSINETKIDSELGQ